MTLIQGVPESVFPWLLLSFFWFRHAFHLRYLLNGSFPSPSNHTFFRSCRVLYIQVVFSDTPLINHCLKSLLLISWEVLCLWHVLQLFLNCIFLPWASQVSSVLKSCLTSCISHGPCAFIVLSVPMLSLQLEIILPLCTGNFSVFQLFRKWQCCFTLSLPHCLHTLSPTLLAYLC